MLPDALLLPAAYPAELFVAPGERGPAAAVSLIETHISWVFLLERDVFKVKKPVDFGFLDFRSLAARQADCEAELRLNSRLAPGVYRAVVPVCQTSDGDLRVVLSGQRPGPVVDWAVHMTRLPDAARLDNLLTQGQLDRQVLAEVATRIAAFHQAQDPSPELDEYASPEAIARNLMENYEGIAGKLEEYLSPEEAAELVDYQLRFLQQHGDAFRARVAGGRVRDTHGDLRLEHLYREPDGTILAIDCLEFSDRFRYSDVCADVAFLSMDLSRLGRVDLAEQLLAAYARSVGDFELYRVVDFYQSYRAFVRGKIAAWLAADQKLTPQTREHARAQARRCFRLALSARQRPLVQPILIAVGGWIGAGKSTVAERIALDSSCPWVSADLLRKQYAGVEGTHSLAAEAWAGAYSQQNTEQVYRGLLDSARWIVDSGRCVVLDASFRSTAQRAAVRNLAAELGVPFHFVECRASEALCRQRLALRANAPSISDGRLEIFDDFVARFEPVVELSEAEHSVVDTSRPLDETVAALEGRLGVVPAGLVN